MAFALALLLLLSACASLAPGFTVNYSYDPEADFARFETYDWAPIPESAQTEELTVKNVKYAVRGRLAGKGLRPTSREPDLLIAMHTGREKRVELREWGYRYGDRFHGYGGYWSGYYAYPGFFGPTWTQYRRWVDRYEYEIGTLILDFVDARSKELIWRGAVRGVVEDPVSVERINEAVRTLLVHFPPETRELAAGR